MSKKKRTTQQEKAEIRRQAFASAQGKVQRLNKNLATLMENNRALEEENTRLARSNQELKQKIIELESKIAFIQMTEGNRSIILIALIIGSIIVSTLITIFAYGFGDLVDTNRQILKRMNSQQ